MNELNDDLSEHASKSLDDIEGEFDADITMGCGHDSPWVLAKRRQDWALLEPKNMADEHYRHVRDKISLRIRTLL